MSASTASIFTGSSQSGDLSKSARRILIYGLGFQLAMFVPSIVAYWLDERLLNDINIWTKPIKFQLSLGMVMVTLLWLLPQLSPERLASRLVRWSALAAVMASTVEIAYITLQSARERGSHFYFKTPLEVTLYQLMGIGAVTIVAGCFLIGFAIWKSRRDGGPQGLWLGAALGLMIGAVLTLLTAGAMSGPTITTTGHWVGGVLSDANGLPLVGWSTTGGDLRVPHFFATHIMQALPILGLLADRLAPASASRIVIAGALISVLVVVAAFTQAAMGMPFLPL